MFNDRCGGGKGGGSEYDPQIGRSATQAAATAAKAEAFSENYYNSVIAPMLKQQSAAATDSQTKLGNLYDLNADQMRLAADRYKQYGIPAEERYYEQAQRYSEPEEFERQAQEAKGDLGVAQANQNEQMARRMSALGIDPTSPGAVSAMNDQAVMGAAAQASAMNRARGAARTLGMQLTSDAANFGRGGQSGILQFGAGAQGNTLGAFGVANQALGGASTAANGVMQGYQTALSGYGNIMDNYTKLGSSSMQASADASAGMWGGIGSLVGTGAGLAVASDVRLKENITDLDATLPSGIKLYRFNYIGDDTPHIGVMAQEVLPVIPEAVSVGEDGYYRVNYGMLR